jgi:hypothetical protein
LHSSQSCSCFAFSKSLKTCSSPVSSSSKVCRTSRYPPAVFRLPFCSDSSNSSRGGGRCANKVCHDRASVLRVH